MAYPESLRHGCLNKPRCILFCFCHTVLLYNFVIQFLCRKKKVIEEIFQPQSCHCLGDSFRKDDHGVVYSQVIENRICGCQPAFSMVMEEIMVKKENNCPEFQIESVTGRLFLLPKPCRLFCHLTHFPLNYETLQNVPHIMI